MAAASAFQSLCSDYPEVDDERLAALEAAFATHSIEYPLCPALLAGAAYGAARAPTSVHSVMAGLVAAPAPASRYASVYAVGCVLRTCALLVCNPVQAIDSSAPLLRDLAHYEFEEPTTANEQIPEVVLPDITPADDSDGEVWAAEHDDDDEAYEPILSPSTPPAADATTAAARATAPPRICRCEAARRLNHLVASLSHDALAPLVPGAWGRLGLGDAIRSALGGLPVAAEQWQVVKDREGSTAWQLPDGSGTFSLARFIARAEASLLALLREHLLHEPAGERHSRALAYTTHATHLTHSHASTHLVQARK